MGLITSRFKKKEETIQVLENLEKEINSIEEYLKLTEIRERRVVGNLVLYSVLIYLFVIFVYYMYFASKPVRENILYFIPLLIYPLLIMLLKRFMSWYYKRRIDKHEEKLIQLKSSKKNVLEDVMNKETYKKAKEILEKFAPEQLNHGLRNKSISKSSSLALYKANAAANPAATTTLVKDNQIITQRSVLGRPAAVTTSPRNMMDSDYEIVPNVSFQNAINQQPKFPLIRPILSRDRSPFDKLVDMLIGDGPSNRYALICKTCGSHNGMALKHEFEFLAFRCAYCLQFNPARKQKPYAPNLSHDERNESPQIYELDENSNLDETDEKENGSDVVTDFQLIAEESENSERLENSSTQQSYYENETTGEDNTHAEKCEPILSTSAQNFDMTDLQNAIADINVTDDNINCFDENVTVAVSSQLVDNCSNESDILSSGICHQVEGSDVPSNCKNESLLDPTVTC